MVAKILNCLTKGVLNLNLKKKKKETNEGLALDILVNALGNEESMNQACDLIKAMGLVDDYY